MMYLIFAIIFLILLLLVFFGYRHRARIIRKIRFMPAEEKCSLLNDIIRPFGYAYIPRWDIFTSRIDAWQREFGYCDLYDKSAVNFNMVIDCLPVYFDYQGETWLIEFWKGQYGINTGCEIGIYHAGRILEPGERKSAVFQSVENSQMLKMSLVLYAGTRLIAKLGARHWWLTAFRPGTFCPPSYLTLRAILNFPNSGMADAFSQGLMKAGVDSGEIKRHQNSITFRFHTSRHSQGLQARIAQWANQFWCRVYLSVTRPFSLSIDRILYLYEFLPFAFRKMVRIRRFKGKRGKAGIL